MWSGWRPASGAGRSYGAPAACWRQDTAARPARWHSGDLTAQAGGERGRWRCANRKAAAMVAGRRTWLGGARVATAQRAAWPRGVAAAGCGHAGHARVCAHAVQARVVRGSGANQEAATSWRARERGASRASSCVRGARVRTRPGRGVAQLGVVSSCARVREPGRAHGSRAARLSSAWRGGARPGKKKGRKEKRKGGGKKRKKE